MSIILQKWTKKKTKLLQNSTWVCDLKVVKAGGSQKEKKKESEKGNEAEKDHETGL